MANVKVCDNCGKPITEANPAIAKLYLTPYVPGRTRSQHSNYSGHMDIGMCCREPILKKMRWQRRKKQKAKTTANGSS